MAGFSLIEIMISVVIFSIVILSLAGLSFQVARRATRATDQSLVMGELFAHVDRASTIDFDSLGTLAPCDTMLRGTVNVISCTTTTVVSARQSTVRVVVRTTVPGGRPDTVTMTRSKQRQPIPLR